jgi:hypothetical protein
MTPQDLIDAQPVAVKIIETIKDMRPPAAVAAVALALAGTAHLAECGPNAARELFESYYAKLASLNTKS